MPLHMTYNTISRVFSIVGNCITVYKRNGEKVKNTFYADIKSAQKAYLDIIECYSA